MKYSSNKMNISNGFVFGIRGILPIVRNMVPLILYTRPVGSKFRKCDKFSRFVDTPTIFINS